MAGANNLIHRRRAARNEVKECRQAEAIQEEVIQEPTPQSVAKKKSSKWKKKK
jgi:hypothetical protein